MTLPPAEHLQAEPAPAQERPAGDWLWLAPCIALIAGGMAFLVFVLWAANQMEVYLKELLG